MVGRGEGSAQGMICSWNNPEAKHVQEHSLEHLWPNYITDQAEDIYPGVKGGAMKDHRGGEKLYHLAPLCSINVRANC